MKSTTSAARAGKQQSNTASHMTTLAISLMLAFGLPATPAHAQSAAQQIAIPAQSLANALVQLASQASLELIYSPSIVAGLQAPAISGNLTPDEALTRLLANTNIQFRRNGNNVSLTRIQPVQAPTELSTISVVGSAASKAGGLDFKDTRSVAVVERGDMDDHQARKIDEALQYQAGIFSEPYGKDNKNNWFKLRGFDASVSLDGTPTSPNSFFSWVPESYGVESIEVIKGANSFLYGPSESGGVINLVSKRPKLTPEGEINVTLGTQNARGISGDYSGLANEDGSVRYRLVGQVRAEDGTQNYAKMDHYYVAPSLTWDISPRTSLTVLASVQKENGIPTSGFLPGYGSLINTPYGKIDPKTFIGEPDVDRLKRSEISLGYEVQHSFDNGWQISQNYRFNRMNLDMLGLFAYGSDNNQTAIRGYSYSKGASVTHAIDNRASKTWRGDGIDTTLLFGLDYLNAKTDGDNNGFGLAPGLNMFNPVYGAPVSVTSTPYRVDTEQLGVYATGKVTLNKKWLFNAGIRHDKAKNDGFVDGANIGYEVSNTSYSGGVMYMADNGLSPYVNYSESFKPTAGVDGYGTMYKPYKGKQYEAGVKYTPHWMDGTISLAYFDLTEQNALVSDASNRSIQAGKRTNKGIELQMDSKVTRNLTLQASYTHNDSRQDLSTTRTIDTPLVPTHMASVWAKYRLTNTPVLNGLTIGGGVRYIGTTVDERYYAGVTIPAYTLLDAMAQYQFDNHWQLQINARNLTNKTYIAGCSFYCFYGADRSVEAQLSYKW